MEIKELLKKVRKIEIKTKGLSKHLFSGEYHSTFKGRGMSFSEVRAYQYGDDIRTIDWNVTARSGEAHIKVFEEERELTVMFLIDVSRSSNFGTEAQFKNDIITEIAATLAFSALSNNDKVGAILFTDKIEHYIPPKKGKGHVLRIIRELLQNDAKGSSTDIEAALIYLNNILKKRSIVFLISDFIADKYEDALRIAKQKHDVVGLHIFDERETELPNIGVIHMMDSESGKTVLVDSSSRKIRQDYTKWYQSNKERMSTVFRKIRADLVHINTKDDYIKSLLVFFKYRSKR